ncbi:MAG: SpoIIE family protein phosphatase [Bacteroidia bacterium]
MRISFLEKYFLFLIVFLLPFFSSALPQNFYSILIKSDKKEGDISFGNGIIKFKTPSVKTNSLWILDKDWKYASGDDTTWARTNFDDSKWDTTVSTEIDLSKLKQNIFTGACWFRLHVLVDSSLRNKSMTLFFIPTHGAADVYVDGKLIFSIGKFSTHSEEEETASMLPHSIVFNSNPYHTIAIRYSNYAQLNYFLTKSASKQTLGFEANLVEDDFGSTIRDYLSYGSSIIMAIVAFYCAMTIVHLLLFVFYREQKSNLYYFLFTLSVSAYLYYAHNLLIGAKTYLLWEYLLHYMDFGIGFFMIGFLYSVFYKRMPKMFWILFFVNIAFILAKIITPETSKTLSFILSVLCILLFVVEFVESLRVSISALLKKREGAWIMAMGVLFIPISLVLMIVISVLQSAFKWTDMSLFPVFALAYSFVCIPISMSIYLARNFSLINKNLKYKLIEVEQLSAQTLQQEQEKKKILEGQKDQLEKQVTERTAELIIQKKEIEEKNKNITDSIQYAKRIQEAMLPEVSFIQKYLPQSFVLFQPRDIVSGDFYWFCDLPDSSVLIAVADCTGHGVPGAFMSMIGHTLLDEIVKEKKITKPSFILDELHNAVRVSLKQNYGDSRDGMDIALCKINTQDKKLEYAGAMRPLWIYNQQGELTETKANKQAIGGMDISQKMFINHSIDLNLGDTIYLSTDGYADQFGGKEGKKMMVKNFKHLLSEITFLKKEEQQKKLLESFKNWKGTNDQVDDVLVIGIKI